MGEKQAADEIMSAWVASAEGQAEKSFRRTEGGQGSKEINVDEKITYSREETNNKMRHIFHKRIDS